MNSFIEVTEKFKSTKHYISIDNIREVVGNTIFFTYNSHSAHEQCFIQCKETYEEIKREIDVANNNSTIVGVRKYFL